MEKTEEQLLNELKDKIKDAIFTKAFKEIDKKTGKSVFVVSDDVEDREGEVISTEGWKLENYKRYPVLLWSHNPAEPLIGHGTNLRYRTVNGRKRLTFEPKFHRKSELSKLVADLVEEDWIRGVSVGFRPIKKDDNVYTKQELLEISFVNVPANPNALSLVYAKGYKDEVIDKVMDVKKAKAMKDKIEQSEKMAKAAKEILAEKEKEAKEIKENPEKEIKKEVIKDTKKEQPEKEHKEEKQEFNCECIECGHKMVSKEHCSDIKCPECGGETRRAERPGPGKEYQALEKKIDALIKTVKELKEEKDVIKENNKKIKDRLKEMRIDLDGLNPDENFNERLSNIENNLVDLAEGLKSLSGNQDKTPQKSGDRSTDAGGQKTVRIAKKALNIITEVLNKELKD